MKYLLLFALLTCATAHATDAPDMCARPAPGYTAKYAPAAVRIVYTPDHLYVTGDTVPACLITQRFYMKEPCHLPSDGTRVMYVWWSSPSWYDDGPLSIAYGCWHATPGRLIVLKYGDGFETYTTRSDLGFWPLGILQSNGSVVITEPNYRSEAYFPEVQ